MMFGYYDKFLSETRKEGTVETVQTPLDSLGSSVEAYKKQNSETEIDLTRFTACDFNRAIHWCDHPPTSK